MDGRIGTFANSYRRLIQGKLTVRFRERGCGDVTARPGREPTIARPRTAHLQGARPRHSATQRLLDAGSIGFGGYLLGNSSGKGTNMKAILRLPKLSGSIRPSFNAQAQNVQFCR